MKSDKSDKQTNFLEDDKNSKHTVVISISQEEKKDSEITQGIIQYNQTKSKKNNELKQSDKQPSINIPNENDVEKCNYNKNIFCYVITEKFFSKSLNYVIYNYKPIEAKAYSELNVENGENFMENIQDIININCIFKFALNDPKFKRQIYATRENFIQFIKDNYWSKAFFLFIIQILFVFTCIILRIYLIFNQYKCINEEQLLEYGNYWRCKKYGKCIVIKGKLDFIDYIRLTYYFIFFLFFIF